MIFQGRLVADIELKFAGESSCAEFTIAWSEKYKEKETKCFLRCKAWRATADFLDKYFSKGQEIVIVGKMVTEEWTKDGEKKNRTICVVDEVSFCGSKNSNSESGTSNHAPSNVTGGDGFMNIPYGIDEELPFN